jgi:hypothetical protein
LLALGVFAFFYVAGLQDAAGNSLIFVIPGALVGILGVRLIQMPPTGWRRLFLVAAGLYLLWTIVFIAGRIGVLFVPSAVCALIAALLANGV